MATGFQINGIELDSVYTSKGYVLDIYRDLPGNLKTPQLWTCGYNSNGALGDNTTSNRSSPVTTIAGGTNWKQVSGGYNLTAAIKTDGTLWTWGYNASGQLGDNTTTFRSSPVTTIAGGTNWKQVACGLFNTTAIKTDGTLWTWGRNDYGQLGNNTSGNGSSKSSPVTTVGGGTNWKQVAGGQYNTVAIKTDGTLWVWGRNNFGQLGTNNTVSYSSPVTTIAGGTNWKSVACGYYFTAAIKTDGTLWTCGYNSNGQLGDNTTSNRSSPVTTIAGGTNWKSVSAAGQHIAAIKTDGTLWTWGYNASGQLGDNTTSRRSSPATTVAGGSNWKSVACGYNFTAAIKTDGTLWTWGYNVSGQLGTNNVVSYSSPVTTIAGRTNWKSVACGQNHMVAISESEGW